MELQNPDYMVDNQHNYFGTAPDKGMPATARLYCKSLHAVVLGTQNGAVWLQSGSFHNFSSFFSNGLTGNNRIPKYGNEPRAEGQPAGMAASKSSYWLAELAPKGQVQLAIRQYGTTY